SPVILLSDETQHAHCIGWLAIRPRLPLHQNELDVILNDGIGFVRLSQKRGSIVNFKDSIRNLVPNDRCEIVKAKPAAMLLNGGVKRDNLVCAVLSPREANITNDDYQASSSDQNTLAFQPDAVQFLEEDV